MNVLIFNTKFEWLKKLSKRFQDCKEKQKSRLSLVFGVLNNVFVAKEV